MPINDIIVKKYFSEDNVVTVPFFVLSVIAIGIIVVTLLFALKWRILAKMGIRNATRRKMTMFLIIAGSLTGTAFIVGSFVINDSFQYFMYAGIRKNLGTIDEVLTPNKDAYFSQDDLSKLINSSSNSKYVESVLPIMIKSTVAAPVGQIKSLDPSKIAQVSFIGVNIDQLKKFGSGKLFPDVTLSGNDVVVGESFADSLKLHVGDTFEAIINPFQIILGAPQKFKIVGIVPEDGVLGYKDIQGITSPIFMTTEQMKNIFNFDSYNEILVANKGNYISSAQYTNEVDQAIKDAGVSVKIYNVKDDQIKNIDRGQIGWLFLILSGFSIAAGILLLINVYTMLSDERISDLGTLRAIGFSRGKVGFILYFEGFVYSLIASFLGVFVGLGIAWFMINEFSNLASNVSSEFTPLMNTGNFSFSLHFSIFSLIYGFLVGLIVPSVVLIYMAFRTGRLNIVGAIRQIPPEKSEKKRQHFLIIFTLFSLDVIFSVFAIFSSNAIMTYSGIMIAALIFPFFFNKKGLRRIVGNFFSLGVVVFAFASNLIPYIESQSDKSLWLLGLRSFSILLAALFLLSYNFEIFDSFLGLFSNKKSRASVKLAVAETAQHKRRTGLTIAMYSIVIFVISLMTVIPYSETLQINSAKSTIFGGYDTVGIPIIGNLNVTTSQLSNLDYITYYATMSMISVKYLSNGKVSSDYQMVLLNKQLVGGLDLQVKSAINGIKDLKSLFDYIDAHPGTVAVLGLNDLKINQNVQISSEGASNFNFSQSSQNVTSSSTVLKNPKTFTVVGILQSQGNYNAIPTGFYTSIKSASVFGKLSSTEFLLTKLAGNNDAQQYDNFQKLTAFLKTRFIFALFSKQTVEVFTNILNGFVNIINTFLYFGLSVGIIGLAILIVKSLHERRRTVGILKALGFSRSMIFRSFFLEINFVVILGILIGFISGIVTSYLIYSTLNLGTLYIPWQQFLLLGIVFYLISVLTTFIPTRNATKVPPVEALRYRE
jgi:putative ABC transport system permease protein